MISCKWFGMETNPAHLESVNSAASDFCFFENEFFRNMFPGDRGEDHHRLVHRETRPAQTWGPDPRGKRREGQFHFLGEIFIFTSVRFAIRSSCRWWLRRGQNLSPSRSNPHSHSHRSWFSICCFLFVVNLAGMLNRVFQVHDLSGRDYTRVSWGQNSGCANQGLLLCTTWNLKQK